MDPGMVPSRDEVYAMALAVVLGEWLFRFVKWAVKKVVPRSGLPTPMIPRGSTGWPLIGETLDFANADPQVFVAPRVKKYGPVFQSHIAGVPSIVVTTPDMAKFVYSDKNKFRASYPSTIATLIGKKSLSSCEPARHPFLKRIVHQGLLPGTLRQEVGRLESFVLDTLNSWNDRTVQTATELKEFTLVSAVYFIFGIEDIRGSSDGSIWFDAYKAIAGAFYAVPINLPGFTWHAALKTKKRAFDYCSILIAQSRKDAEAGKPCNSLLRALVIAVDDDGKKLEDDEIIDVLIGTLFGAHDTTATALTWIIKFLTENPETLKAVTEEQEEIARQKEPGQGLTWEDTRKMPCTSLVFQETLRCPTILQFTSRVANEDVVYKDYLIPKGWRVYVMTTAIHLDSANHPSPTEFDPSRFKVAPKSGTYLPFAFGAHACPGNELAKLNVLIFVHHLATKYRWKGLLPEMGTQFKPFPMPKGGYPIEVHQKEN